jgi:hypothetical protein
MKDGTPTILYTKETRNRDRVRPERRRRSLSLLSLSSLVIT